MESSTYKDYDAVQKALDILEITESTKVHRDQLEILTSPYGLILEQGHPAFTYNSMLATELGISLHPKLDIDSYRQIAERRLREAVEYLELTLGDKLWEELSTDAKTVLLDSHYHTGKVYRRLAEQLVEYDHEPTHSNLLEVVMESTRVIEGDRTEGLDNRVATVLYYTGYVDSVQDANSLGLIFATYNGNIPKE